MKQVGLYADRLSINLEIPTESGLKLLAPEKRHADMIAPMQAVTNEIIDYQESKKKIKSTPKFARAG